MKDYLEIEKARYEERLTVEWDIAKGSDRVEIPPLLLQTIVENCIKHGIAKLPDGGRIVIQSTVMMDVVEIDILNSGQYDPDGESDSSLGLENTRNRLSLSFGKEGWLTIGNHGNQEVKTTVRLPIKSSTT